MNNERKKTLISYFDQYITANKKEKITTVLEDRTRYVTVILEDIFQSHNASAIMRSCEIFGLQDIHVIEKAHQFKPMNGVAMGAGKWINTYSYPNVQESITTLKEQGYTIVATTVRPDAYQLHELPLDSKIALVFGTENVGLTKEAEALADYAVTIPMYGFTQSFNVSVSVALCLYDIMQRLRASSLDWHLSEQEKLDLTLAWYRALVRGAATHEKLLLD